MTAWERHVADWSDCTKCPLHLTRGRVVLARGHLPCDVLLVGEAPGTAEDALGVPFVGPAGQLLDSDLDPVGIVQRAGLRESGLRLAFTNLLGCIPLDEDREKVENFDDCYDSVIACSPRLVELAEMARPKLIVCVGGQSRDWLDPKMLHSVKVDRSIPRIHIDHPARILRAPWAHRSLMVQRCVVTLRNACQELK